MKHTLRLLTVLLLAPQAALHADEAVMAQTRWENSELICEQPAASPNAGQPIGNGRMGTMVWTAPEAIHLQINRVDVFAVNRDHPGSQFSATDYCGGIAGVVVHVGGQPFAPGGKSFRQRLSLANAECVIEGDGLQVQCFVSANADVLVMEVDDRRASPEPLKVTVSMLREPEVIAGENIAASVFSENQNRIVLTQRFRERDYHNASAVAVDVVGNKAEIVKTSETNQTLLLPASPGKRVMFISSAAAWKPDGDVAAAAVAVADAAIVQKLVDLAPRHASVLGGAGLGTAIRSPIAVARAGRGKELPKVLERYHAAFAPLPNGMSLFEGPTAASVEHLGLLSVTLQEALLQSVSARPGEPEVIRVFPAWPPEWEAAFRLLARGGFLISSEIKEGKVVSVEIESRLGEDCRLRNPWGAECLLAEVGGPSHKLSGEILHFPTQTAKRYRLSPP